MLKLKEGKKPSQDDQIKNSNDFDMQQLNFITPKCTSKNKRLF